MIFTFLFVLSLILFTKNIVCILCQKCDVSIFFYIISIIVLTLSLYIFWIYFNNLSLSLILSLLLMIITFIFILELKTNYKQNITYTLPYFLLTIYIFAKIINSFLFLAHR